MTNKNEVATEKQANSVVLYAALAVNIILFMVNIYQSGFLIAQVTGVPISNAMWMTATQGGSIYATLGILICLIIGILYKLNAEIGKKVRIIESIARILLKLPINFVLLIIALWVAWIGYAKFNVGVSDANLLGGGYVLDWVSAIAILFLVFFVKKI